MAMLISTDLLTSYCTLPDTVGEKCIHPHQDSGVNTKSHLLPSQERIEQRKTE